MSNDLLFNKYDIFNVMEGAKRALKDKVSDLPYSPEADPEQLIAGLVADFSIDVPILKKDELYATQQQTKVDVSGDPRRFFLDRSRPFYIPATEITIHVPFTGEQELFWVQPTSFSLSPPRGNVTRTELLLTYTFTDEVTDLKPQYERAISEIERYLQNLRYSAVQLASELKALASNAVAQRRTQAEQHSKALASLGIPIREVPKDLPLPIETTQAATKQRNKATKPQKQPQWDVFISHASEDKQGIATDLANALIAAGVRVWYDDFSLKLGDSLRRKIDEGLAKSRYGIVILSPFFFEKHWPQQELNGLMTRESHGKVVIPIWHNIGKEEVAQYSPILADRKAASTSDGLQSLVAKILDVLQ